MFKWHDRSQCTHTVAEGNRQDRAVKKREIENYEQAVEYILDVPKFTKKNDMNETRLDSISM